MNYSNLTAAHPGWLIAMIGGFIYWWPLGILVLAYLLWSGSMGRINGQWLDRAKAVLRPGSGNTAFDAHRVATLRRLEDEARDFRVFMDKLRLAKDEADFARFMKERNQP